MPHHYALGQLHRAMARLADLDDPAARDRAAAKVRRWRDVLEGMASGRVEVGSRTPVADTPAWVTLEVAHGGFATGRYLAEAPLTEDEAARLATLPDDVPGRTNRERLNLWYLGDDGQAELLDALRRGHYRVELPEDAALPVVVLLLDKGLAEPALDLVAELRPLMHRLRFTPRFAPTPRPSGSAVRLASVGTVVESLRAVRVPPRVAAMRETLGVWNPRYDRLVALWCATVEGDLPYLDDTGAVRGGWPCRRWPADWAEQRVRWLDDYTKTARRHPTTGRHAHPKGNFTRLRRALESCPDGSAALSAREVGWIRRALANTLTRHGSPESERRAALRATQAGVVAAPTNAALADLLARRLATHAADGGLSSLDPIAAPVSETDTYEIPAETPIPDHLLRKAARALEAPVDELVRRGIIASGETLAAVLPQLTSRLVAAGLDDPVLTGLYEQTYLAFRRRRGLLLLDLAHQVRFEELPWVSVLAPCRSERLDDATAAHRALREASLLALTAFPHALLPNPLVHELGALASRAGLRLPLVEEVAADIFMGTFTTKWRDATVVASRTMAGTLYARYYDLPSESLWTVRPRSRVRWGKRTAKDFTELCAERAREAGRSRSFVTRNGAVLEQSQILTTHNLAALVAGLDLADQLGDHAPDLATRTFAWLVRRLGQPAEGHAALIQVKNAAYAWRQALFYLSFCTPEEQAAQADQLADQVRRAGLAARFGPAVDGLLGVLAGHRFTATGTLPGSPGRRFLGWAGERHWYLAEPGAR
ncbi:hypothetical protein SAMN05421810_102816 [Amycolatopsis arida]|uniref:Uncharacterized protein n=1 Tax=Amycolatopsis arida TaxID=587909 RepID=A0A1I5QZ54_9PSEU|nr:hypothetical protein [Amycolatopsis arida]TDX99016.1 hypothetical protein CLV69_101817 [Amycolatopsis arida]SFP51594.1 hypothetical protein SAMN05421810_102816 [Amycolatopsis arida]